MEYIEENDYRYTKLGSKFHRDNDLPVIIYTNGDQYWYKEGKRHINNDLHSVILKKGYAEWWVKDVMIKLCKNYQQKVKSARN